MTATTKKEFLTQELPELLKGLQIDTEANFGLMTPQHMIEHIAYVVKMSIKRTGEPENPPTKGQLGFKKFIANGAILQHRPSDKSKADLPELKYSSLEKALEQVPIAVERFYTHFEAHPDTLSYNPFFGELSFEELELFHYQHLRYHAWQFGLIENYGAAEV
ncbi:MAG: DUF1569 domain-containing protein [Chitinophagales bacterium]